MTNPETPREETAGGVLGKLAGKAKAAAGSLTGNDDLAREGRLQEATVDAERDGADLADVLAVALDKAGMSGPDVPGLFDPSGYTGISGPLVDRVLTRFDGVLEETSHD